MPLNKQKCLVLCPSFKIIIIALRANKMLTGIQQCCFFVQIGVAVGANQSNFQLIFFAVTASIIYLHIVYFREVVI